MRNTRRQKKAAQTQEPATPMPKKNFFKAEWPLLLVPALVLTALGVLYTVHRSMQQERVPSTPPKVKTSDASGTVEVSETPQANTTPRTTPPANHRSEPRRERYHVAPAPKPGPGKPEKTNTLLAVLGRAVDSEDHTAIKQSMRDLVALGDDAVDRLGEMITQGDGESAAWAAEALARIGTPYAAGMMLTTIEGLEEGPMKEQLAKQMSNITNHDSWPVLMDAFLQNGDATVQRAVSTSLARMADTAIVDEIVTMYDAATTDVERTQLARLVSNISSPKASDSLLTIAGDVSTTPQNSLQEASIKAMANVGDAQCVSHLLQRLEASSPGEGSSLFTAITQIDQPQAQSALLYAAAGNKEVSAEHGQAAAISALANYPNAESYALLQRLAGSSDNATVISAAARAIQRIEQSTPALTETVTSKANP